MDRRYFKLMDKLADCLQKANYVAMNSNYKATIERGTLPYLGHLERVASELDQALIQLLDLQHTMM